ncbi:MAG: hypothetical protein ACI4QT_05520 [Kiritimatiellia bacterium]
MKALSVAKSTALEGLQSPMALLLTLACVELTALQPLLQLHTFGDSVRMARDCGLAFLLFSGILVCASTSGCTLAADLRSGIAATALAKPIRRFEYLAGKWLGSCIVAAVFAWNALWSTILASRTAEAYVETAQNAGEMRDVLCGAVSVLLPLLALSIAALFHAWKSRRFALSFFTALSLLQPLASLALLGWFARDGSPALHWNPNIDVFLFPAGFLLLLLLLIFCAVTTTLSVRFQTAPAAALSFLLLLSGFLADRFASSGMPGACIAACLPNVQEFWLVDRFADGYAFSAGRLLLTTLHTLFYASAVLSIGLILFRNRDIQ